MILLAQPQHVAVRMRDLQNPELLDPSKRNIEWLTYVVRADLAAHNVVLDNHFDDMEDVKKVRVVM